MSYQITYQVFFRLKEDFGRLDFYVRSLAHEIWIDLSSNQNSYLNDMVLHIDLKSVEQKGSMWIMTLTELAKNMKGKKKKTKHKTKQT